MVRYKTGKPERKREGRKRKRAINSGEAFIPDRPTDRLTHWVGRSFPPSLRVPLCCVFIPFHLALPARQSAGEGERATGKNVVVGPAITAISRGGAYRAIFPVEFEVRRRMFWALWHQPKQNMRRRTSNSTGKITRYIVCCSSRARSALRDLILAKTRPSLCLSRQEMPCYAV